MDIIKPPLHVYLLAHPKSHKGCALAEALQERFVEPPMSGGLRLPVFFTPERSDGAPPFIGAPDGIDLDAAQHSVVVIFADERMLRSVPEGAGVAWKQFVETIRQAVPVTESPHHLLCVALDTQGFSINEEIHVLPSSSDPTLSDSDAFERQLSGISFHIAARCIQLLEYGKVVALAQGRTQAPVQVFLSHAKADLRKDEKDPVRATQRACDSESYPIEKWFDSRNIATGQAFDEAIRAGIRDCSIMLVFQSDHYGSRPWCRREVIEAKQLGAHIVVIDILENGEPRRFPYVGNVPVIRWRPDSDSDVEARRIIDRAVLEALRFKFNRAYLKGFAQSDDVVLAAPPEAFNLSMKGVHSKTSYLYPDPPLGREELEVLNALDPSSIFTTPLTRMASSLALANPRWTIAVSISESDDIASYGLSRRLFLTLVDEIHLYLLLAGLKIAYGGALKGDFSKGENFTLRLFDLVRSYSKLAEGMGSLPLSEAIHNIAPWPLSLSYGESEWPLFSGGVAIYEAGEAPELPWPTEEIFPFDDGKWIFPSDTPIRRYAWARGLSKMRAKMTSIINARVVIGGKLRGFAGLVPGVIEEAWMSIECSQPLYIVGAYGGAARALSDSLLGVERPEFSDEWSTDCVPDLDATAAFYEEHAIPRRTLAEIGASIRLRSAQEGVDKILNNGLSAEENIDLMYSSSPDKIASLVLTGISRLAI